MVVRPTAVNTLVTNFLSIIVRADDLHSKLVLNGYTDRPEADEVTPLRHPDRRDVAQFIFFELAAEFESFAQKAFCIEVRKRFSCTVVQAQHIMGCADRGMTGSMGWGSPSMLMQRGKNLFGANGLFGRLESFVGQPEYQRLILAHLTRNRIAHNSDSVKRKFNAVINQFQVPDNVRRGINPGRILVDYPIGTIQTDRWFARFLAAYRCFAGVVQSELSY